MIYLLVKYQFIYYIIQWDLIHNNSTEQQTINQTNQIQSYKIKKTKYYQIKIFQIITYPNHSSKQYNYQWFRNIIYIQLQSIKYIILSFFLMKLILLFCFIALIHSEVPLIDDDIGQAIFHNNSPYIIYVHQYAESKIQQIFEEYCSEKNTLCTKINPQVDQYMLFRKFMGVNKQSYLIIVDAAYRKKYVFQEQLTVQNLKKFYSDFQQDKLTPYFTSEEIPKTNDKVCTKLVGKTIKKFITTPNKDSIILFYGQKYVCEECPAILQTFKDIAYRYTSYYEHLQFGYFDRITNQHPQINHETIPAVLVFTRNHELYKIEKFSVQELEQKIIDYTKQQSYQQQFKP